MDSPVQVWEIKLGRRIANVYVVAPVGASLEEIGRTAKLQYLDMDLRQVRPEHAVHDEEFWRNSVAQDDVTSMVRVAEEYVLHPRIVTTPAQKEGPDV